MTGLPLAAPRGCTLSPSGLVEQGARVAELRSAIQSIESAAGQLHVEFMPDVDTALLADVIETERRCCTFLDLEYDPHQRVLRISSQNHSALAPIAAFFTETA